MDCFRPKDSRDDEYSPVHGDPYGYDDSFRGPKDKRSCTDIICATFFIVFLLSWAVLGYFAFNNGNIARLQNPTDSDFLMCGIEQEVKDKPYLFVFEPNRCADISTVLTGCDSKKVCVSKCPDFDFLASKHLKDDYLQNNLYCVRGVLPQNGKQLAEAVKRRKCPPWIKTSMAVGTLCVPRVNATSDTPLEVEGSTVKGVTTKDVIAGVIRIGSPLNDQGYISRILSDISGSYQQVSVALLAAMAASFIYIILLRMFAAILVWSSIFFLIALLGVGAYFCLERYMYLRGADWNDIFVSGSAVLSEDDKGMQIAWFTLMILCVITALILLIVVIFLRKRISLSVALIRESGRAVSNVMSTLVFPILPWTLYIGAIVYFVMVAIYLHTSGKPYYKVQSLDLCREGCRAGSYTQDNQTCIPELFKRDCSNCIDKGSKCVFDVFKTPDYIIYLHIANLFGFFWLFNFIKGMAEMILAATFATWYWTMKKSNVPFFVLTKSFFVSLTYHSGTVALGALLIAIVQTIRAILEYLDKKLKTFDNGFARCLLCCCQCCCWCLESFLKFISHNAYIMCAIHGKNFCASARDAFNLLMRNVIRVIVLEKVTSFVLFLGKGMISVGVGVGLHFYLKKYPITNLYYVATPLVFVVIGSFIIASIFFGVYNMAVDTLFICFLEDQERNDGSLEKPYFMSKNLMRILGKSHRYKRD